MSNDTVRLLNDLGFDPDVTTDILSEDMEGAGQNGRGPQEWVYLAIYEAMMKEVAPRLLPGETYAFKADGMVYTVRNGEVYCGRSVLRKNAKIAEWPK
jgi:hypothetical protein